MRQGHGVAQLKQRRFSQRFFFIHIQPRAANRGVLQGLDQRRLIDHRATGDVDQNPAGLHQPQFTTADQVFGLLAQRHHQAHEVGFGQELIKAAKLRAHLLFQFGLAAVAAVQDRHVEAEVTTTGYGRADVAHADDTQGLAMHVGAEMRRLDGAFPLTGLGPGVQLGDAAGAAHQQGEGQVGGAFGQHVRGVGQHDPAFVEVAQVVVVVTHGDARHHFQLAGVLQLLAAQFATGADQAMGVRQRLIELRVQVTQLRVGHDHVEVLAKALGHFRGHTAESKYGLFHRAATLGRFERVRPRSSNRGFSGRLRGRRGFPAMSRAGTRPRS